MPFRIMLVGTKNDPLWYRGEGGSILEFEDGAAAQARVKEIAAAGSDQKWRVKRVVDTRWKSREQRKFDDGTYEYVPWEGSSWWGAVRHIHGHHYPHVSRSMPGMVAYTESPDKGMDNKQTQIKPGRYLEKYFAEILKVYGLSIKSLATQYEKDYRPRKVHFATTEDEVQRVYEKGPHSCMSDRPHRVKHGWGWPVPGAWPNGVHACRAYITDEDGLQVAYLTSSDEPGGRIEARALVWPKKKTHSRCYGAEAALRKELGLLGYTPEAPIGARIQRLPVDVHGTMLFITPYIDIGQQAGAGATAVKDKKTYLEIVLAEPGTYPANATSGLCGSKLDRNMRPITHNVVHCQMCNDHTDDVGPFYQIYMSSAGSDFQMWCEACLMRDGTDLAGTPRGAYQCHQDGRYYSRAAFPPVKMDDGSIWSPRAFRAHGFTCKATGKNYPAQEAVRMFNGDKWHLRHFRANGFTCWWSGEHYPNAMKMIMAEGKAMAQAIFISQGFTCEGCSRNWLKSNRSRVRGLCMECANNELRMDARLAAYKVPNTNEEYRCD